MSGIIKPEDLFPFDEYEARIKRLDTVGEEWAQSTVGFLGRIKSAYTAAQKEAADLETQLKGLNIVQGNAGQVLQEYAGKVADTTKKLDTARQAEKNLTDAQQLNAQVVTDLTAKLSSLYQRFQALDPTQKNYEKQQRAILREVGTVTRAIDAQSKSLKAGKVVVDAAESSYQHLSKQTAELKTQLRQMPDAFDLVTGKINQHNKSAVDMLARIQTNDKALKAADSSMGNYGRNVGNYGNAVAGMSKGLLQNLGGLVGITSVFEGLTAVLKITADMERMDAGLKAVSRDTDDFNRSQQFLITTADDLGVRYDSLVKSFKLLKAATKDTSLEGAETEHIFHAVTEAGARLGLTVEDTEGALLALTQMISKGKISAEELRGQLGERVPAAMKIMADATGVTEIELNKMMEKGQLMAVDVLPKFATQLDKIYGGNAQEKITTMSAGWNRMTNNAQLFIAAFNENKKVSTFFGTIENGIAHVLSDLTTLVKSNEWGLFINYMTGGAALGSTVAAAQRAAQNMVAENDRKFRSLPADERQKLVNQADQKRVQIQKELNALLDKAPTADVTAKELKLQNELNKAQTRYNLLVKTNNDQVGQEVRSSAAKAKDQKQKDLLKAEEAEKERKKAQAARTKAQADADRKTNAALGVAKSGTDVKLADLSASKQDGVVSEKDFIEQRKALTIAGIEERQAILEKAGKKESDDYKKLAKDKIDAETQYKRDSLKLSLSDSKASTATSLAGLSSDKSEGVISEQQYVEKKHDITLAGIDDQLRLLENAGQQESQLAKDLNAQRLEADRDYFKERLKAQNASWKKELGTVKDSLKEYDQTVGAEYENSLNKLNEYYSKKQQAVALEVKRGTVSPDEGEAKLHALKLEQLKAELEATEKAYQKDRGLSETLINDRIANLNEYKSQAIRTPAEIAAAEAEINKLKKANNEDAAQDKIDLDKKVAENADKVSTENFEHESKNIDKIKEKRRVLFEQGFQLAQTIGDATFSILSGNSEKETAQLEKQKENELKLAGDNKDAKERIEEQYNKRKAEIARKQAIADREAALFNIALSTAQGVAAVLSTGGGTRYADFGISAGILSAFVIATGAIQAAAILAKPLPAYKYGKLATDNYTGPALAGEAGMELLVDREGYAQIFDKPTVFRTKPGDTVYTASQTRDILADMEKQERTRQVFQEMQFMGETMNRLRAGRLQEQSIIYQVAMQGNSGSALSEEAIYRAMSRAMDERPEHITNIDVDGLSEGIRKGHNYTEHVEKRKRLFP